jgi:predicted dehydrogenase
VSDTNPRVGLIGTGFMAETHTASWQRLGASVVVHSRSVERGRAFAAEHGITAAADLAGLLDQVDVVDICTPTDTHADLTLQAAAAGRDVICEKPLARTPAQGREMISTCRSAGVGLFPAQVLRFFPAYVMARDLVRAGRIGELRALRFARSNASPGVSTWFADIERSGGVLVDLAIHDIDFARWVAGEVTRVEATADPPGSASSADPADLPVARTARLTHAGDLVSEVHAVWDVEGAPLRSSFELTGSEGVLRFESLPSQVLTDGTGAVLFADDGSGDVDPFADQLAEFVAAFAGKVEPRVTADDGLVALTLALAGEEAARTGEPLDPAALLGS